MISNLIPFTLISLLADVLQCLSSINFLARIFHSRAVIFKSGCFVQKYWSGTVTRKTVIQRADDS